MAVYTEVSDEALATFLAGYDLGPVRSFKGIAEGVENSNFLLRTDKGAFILTLYEKRVSVGDLPFFVALMEHLARAGLTCPQPVAARDGSALGVLAGRPAAIVTFLDGIWIRRPAVRHCAALGIALARLHAAGLDFPMRRQNALSVEAWPSVFEPSRTRADGVAPGLADIISTELAVLHRLWPAHLPRGVIHGDLFPDNVFFLEGELSGLIDFYFACTDVLAYDLAICLVAWCFEADGSFDPRKGQALLGAYAGARALSREERAALPLLARGAALRFLLTRLADWLDVPAGALVRPKDPLEYAAKLRVLQTLGTPDQLGLST